MVGYVMKIAAMALVGLMMCGHGKSIKELPTTKGNCFSIAECYELQDKEAKKTYPTSFSLSVFGKNSLNPILTCKSADGHWGDSVFTIHECSIATGHTLDEAMTVIMGQMQDEEHRHRDEVAAIYSDLYRIRSDKTIKKHNAKVSVTK